MLINVDAYDGAPINSMSYSSCGGRVRREAPGRPLDALLARSIAASLHSFTISRATNRCRIAHTSVSSGASNAHTESINRSLIDGHQLFHRVLQSRCCLLRGFGFGMFGWTPTQIQMNMVARQLEMMSVIVRQLSMSLQVDET